MSQNVDVWIVESNTVYRDVPFAVVTDWVTQGRLLDDDRVRLKGEKEWKRIATLADFNPYLPPVDADDVQDEAEAYEPVQMDFQLHKKHSDEGDDPDMVPLIDISLVLLIFFMMTATVGGASGIIPVPDAKFKLLSVDPEIVWVGLKAAPNGGVEYSLGKGDATILPDTTKEGIVGKIDEMIKESDKALRLSLRADKTLSYEAVRDMTTELERFRLRVDNIYAEVSEKESK